MNVKNNRRRQETVQRIESVFMDFLETRDISQITVTAICQRAGINRATFYANYLDIYDLADKLHTRLRTEVNALFEADIRTLSSNADYLMLFQHIFEHIKANQALYAFYFKLGYDESEELRVYDIWQVSQYPSSQQLSYHITFFKSGFNAIVKKWLFSGCRETPEQMRDILLAEYAGRFDRDLPLNPGCD